MVLADLGAEVVRIDRQSGGLQRGDASAPDPVLRGRRVVAADLKDPADRGKVLRLGMSTTLAGRRRAAEGAGSR